jgi:hypothetical protein
MGSSSPITTVHYGHFCQELAAVARVGLATRRWVPDKNRSAAVVLGNHPISVRPLCGPFHGQHRRLVKTPEGALS